MRLLRAACGLYFVGIRQCGSCRNDSFRNMGIAEKAYRFARADFCHFSLVTQLLHGEVAAETADAVHDLQQFAKQHGYSVSLQKRRNSQSTQRLRCLAGTGGIRSARTRVRISVNWRRTSLRRRVVTGTRTALRAGIRYRKP